MNKATEYWDSQAKRKFAFLGAEKKIVDNIWKRQAIVRRLLACDFYEKSILEIGVGPGTTFAAIKLILLNRFNYIGTDVSKEYVDFVKNKWKMKVIQTDVTNLPGGNDQYDYIVALDSLAHVPPNDRLSGFIEINRVLKSKGCIILNITKDIKPDPSNFDWGFFDGDLFRLTKICNLRIEKLEPYAIRILETGEIRNYVFFIGRKQI